MGSSLSFLQLMQCTAPRKHPPPSSPRFSSNTLKPSRLPHTPLSTSLLPSMQATFLFNIMDALFGKSSHFGENHTILQKFLLLLDVLPTYMQTLHLLASIDFILI